MRKEASSLDIALPGGTGNSLNTLSSWLAPCSGFPTVGHRVLQCRRRSACRRPPGRLALSDEGLRQRDRMVIGHFRGSGAPVCGVIGAAIRETSPRWPPATPSCSRWSTSSYARLLAVAQKAQDQEDRNDDRRAKRQIADGAIYRCKTHIPDADGRVLNHRSTSKGDQPKALMTMPTRNDTISSLRNTRNGVSPRNLLTLRTRFASVDRCRIGLQALVIKAHCFGNRVSAIAEALSIVSSSHRAGDDVMVACQLRKLIARVQFPLSLQLPSTFSFGSTPTPAQASKCFDSFRPCAW